MATNTLRPLAIIRDNDLRNWAKNARFLKEFPFLKSLARAENSPKSRGCSSCRKGNVRASEIFSAARRTIGSLPPAKKQILKQLLGAKKIRVSYKTGTQTTQLTF